jgi:cAMP-binding proteins - catabolite gene activator and regulatory subunit of cAMP-dependent protein kinases
MPENQLVARILTCPACESIFSFHTPKSRAYQLVSRDADYCPHYEGINPLFYQVWVCPRCSFAAYKEHWKSLSEAERIGMRQISSEAKEGLRFDFAQPERTLFAAILSFKLAYRCYMRRMPSAHDHLGSIQLRLAWLCRLGNDRKREIQHMGAAMAHFAEAFDHGRNLTTSPGKIAYLMGELSRRVGNGASAVEWFMRAIKEDPGKGEIYRLSRDQLYEAKESIRFFQYLQGVDFLKPLPIEQLAELAPQIKSHRVAPGSMICRKGEKASSMYILVKGEVRIHPGEVKEPPVATLQAGQYFGEACLLTGQPRNASAVAVEECELLEIDRLAFKTILASHPDILAELSRVVSFRAQQVERWRDGMVTESGEQGQESLMGKLLSYFEIR